MAPHRVEEVSWFYGEVEPREVGLVIRTRTRTRTRSGPGPGDRRRGVGQQMVKGEWRTAPPQGGGVVGESVHS